MSIDLDLVISDLNDAPYIAAARIAALLLPLTCLFMLVLRCYLAHNLLSYHPLNFLRLATSYSVVVR